MISYTCPSCHSKCSVGDQFAGRKMKCPKCGARIRHHPGKEIELLSPGTPPPPAPAGAAPAWSSMDTAAPPPPAGAPPATAPATEEKKGSTVAVAIVPELVGKLVSQSESKQNILVIWGAVAVLALSISVVGFLMRDLKIGVAPIAITLVAFFIWLQLRLAKQKEAAKARHAAKEGGKKPEVPAKP